VIYTICTLDDALNNAKENVRMTARNVAATLKAGQQLR
jgi:glycerate kinase